MSTYFSCTGKSPRWEDGRRFVRVYYSLGVSGSTALNLPPLESILIRGQFSVSGQDNEFRFAAYFCTFRCARVCFMSTLVAWI